MRTSREEWAKRIERWNESDLTAAEFSLELGINPRTLSYWKWRLGKETGAAPTKRRKAAGGQTKRRKSPRFVEVTPDPSLRPTARLEVVVNERLVVRVPDSFDAETLRRVLQALGAGT